MPLSNVARDLNDLAQLLKATHRFAEAEPLMRRQLVIFLKFPHETGRLHPHLRDAFYNYVALLKEISLGDEQTAERLALVGIDAGLDPQSLTKLFGQL